ncbi:MAG: TonB-dependent receptor [Acidobacteria bacterium]|nr:TonB-dependent receptor [Acidobacteriota bacterium]
MDLVTALLALALKVADVQRPRLSENVVVISTAPSLITPSAITVLGADELASTPSSTLDDALRSVPGFSLFRRSSSRVANPTTQGVTLRGLAASGSSRALVLADGVPLNDPVGGWIYWNRVPVVALREAAVARGAAGDLHGADALAGVVTLRSLETSGARVLVEGGSDVTGRVSGFGGGSVSEVALFGAAEAFTTDGFVITAPESRGSIDVPASSRHGSAHAAVNVPAMTAGHVLLRGSHFGESRGNGTPIQRNGTRVSQVSASVASAQGWSVRGYALTQRYEQTFSAVASQRTFERQTSEQDVSAAALGGWAEWAPTARALSATVSGKFVDARLAETVFTADGARISSPTITPQQMDAAVSLQTNTQRGRVSFGGGIRGELWQSQFTQRNRHWFVSPRLWTAWAATNALTLRLALQSGHRGPTLNELYRPFRVGSVLTEANPDLRPESARGVEAGASWHKPRIAVRALGFWSRVSDAIVNVTLASSGPTILRQRQNAARLRAAGAELEVEIQASRFFVFTGSSSFTRSDFAGGTPRGLAVPQVPRAHHALGGRGTVGKLRLSGEWRYIGRQFDDDRNQFALDRSALADARAGLMVTRRIELFGAVENVLDDEQDVGRTPLRTIGLPRTSRVGLRLVF